MKKFGSVLIGFFIPIVIFSQTFTEIIIYPQGTYYPYGIFNSENFGAVNDELFFIAATGRISDTTALWKTDGTQVGSVEVKSPIYNFFGVFDNLVWEHFTLNGKLFFRGVASKSNDPYGAELWTSDGTEAGTFMVKDIYPGPVSSGLERFTAFNNEYYFLANDSIHGSELWKTDGTEAGTMMVSDISAGSLGSSPNDLTAFGNMLIFSADVAPYGRELWKTDGTEAGTMLVKDINPGATASNIGNITFFNDELYFSASDGTHGIELWKTDGTAAGTVMVKDIHAGNSSSTPNNFIVYNGKLYFKANDGVHGIELWRTDGTEAGTELVKDIRPGSVSSAIGRMIVSGNHLFFRATDGVNGTELWKSDGTDAGTTMIADINPGSGSSYPENFVVYNDKLYFNATSNGNDVSIYETDGTEAGTKLFAPIDAVGIGHLNDAAYSNPRLRATAFNGALYFWANYYGTGSQLWKYESETTNMKEQSKNTFQLYPNPVTNHLHIDFGKSYSNITLDVHNINGQLVERKNLQNIQQHELNVSQWNDGLYFISMVSEEGVMNSKFVKQ